MFIMMICFQLSQVGEEGFVQAEGEALMELEASDCVISLTGSNPMHPKGNQHVRSTGVTVFLDTKHSDITKVVPIYHSIYSVQLL